MVPFGFANGHPIDPAIGIPKNAATDSLAPARLCCASARDTHFASLKIAHDFSRGTWTPRSFQPRQGRQKCEVFFRPVPGLDSSLTRNPRLKSWSIINSPARPAPARMFGGTPNITRETRVPPYQSLS